MIYKDKELSESMFFIHKGKINLYAENNYPFETFIKGQDFGGFEMVLNLRRIGTAVAGDEDAQLYEIRKPDLHNALMDHRETYNGIKYACMQNAKELITKKLAILKKWPLVGMDK